MTRTNKVVAHDFARDFTDKKKPPRGPKTPQDFKRKIHETHLQALPHQMSGAHKQSYCQKPLKETELSRGAHQIVVLCCKTSTEKNNTSDLTMSS